MTPRGHHERALDHGKAEIDEAHEINVTPFIDVMLVLLIIFMVAQSLAAVPETLQDGRWSER